MMSAEYSQMVQRKLMCVCVCVCVCAERECMHTQHSNVTHVKNW